MIYLHENGVTVVAKSGAKGAKGGEVYELNGFEYYVAKDHWDLKKIIDDNGYKNIPLNRIVTSKITTMNNIINRYGKGKDFNEDISSWDTSRVKSMSDMFLGCEKFNQPIGYWDTSNVTAMISMFHGAKSFNHPIGDWDTSKVYNISRIFEGAESFNQNINNWDTSEMNLMTAAFKDANSFNQPLNKWKINSSCQLFSMFENAKSFNQDISNFKVSGSISSFLAGAESFNSPLNWDVSKVKSMKSLFHGAKSFNQDISDWDVSKVTNTENMFYGASSFNRPIGNWKLSSLTNMNNMFREAKSFNQDISQWDVSKVTKMKGLFQDAVSFNQNIKNWKLNEQIKKSRTIFQGASAFDFDKYNPFLNENINEKVVTRKRNLDTSTDNLSSEEKKKFTKIKNLIISRDISKINMGIEILVSLNNNEIYSSLLKDCKFTVNEGGKIELILNKLFSGSQEAQPFLNYSLFSIISIVPNDKNVQIDNSLKIENIKVLDLSSIDFPKLEDVIVMPDLSRFKNLDKLILSFYRKIQTSIKNNSITHLILKHFQGSLKFLSDLPQLEYLELDIDSYEKSIKDLDSFNSLKSLKKLDLDTGGILENFNFLSNCKKLESLSVNLGFSYNEGTLINNINGITELENLNELNIQNVYSEFKLNDLGKLNKLEILELNFKQDCVNFDLSELNTCENLKDLIISGGGISEIYGKVHSVNDINSPKNIKNFFIKQSWRNEIKIYELDKNKVLENEENQHVFVQDKNTVIEDNKSNLSPTVNNNLIKEDKKTFTKIKSLLQTRDFDNVDLGIELLISVENIKFFETFLADCKITEDRTEVIKNKFFTGSRPAQPYLNYALYLLIYHCPEEADIDESIKRHNINELDTRIFFKRSMNLERNFKYRLPEIKNFTHLQELNIDLSVFDLSKSVISNILINQSVKILNVHGTHQHSTWLKNLPQLESLKFGSIYPSEDSANAFKFLVNLRSLEIGVGGYFDIDFLKECKKLKKLVLITIENPSYTKNINALKYLKDLEDLTVFTNETSNGTLSYQGLSYCKKLRSLEIHNNVSDEVFQNISNCHSLEKFSINSSSSFDVKLTLSDFNGLINSSNVKKIKIGKDNINLY